MADFFRGATTGILVILLLATVMHRSWSWVSLSYGQPPMTFADACWLSSMLLVASRLLKPDVRVQISENIQETKETSE